MVLDFGYYQGGLPGAHFIITEAAKLGCGQLFANIFAVVVRLEMRADLGSVMVLAFFIDGLLGLIWACAVCIRRPWGHKRLLSLPGGQAFAALSSRLGPELRTVWLGENADCHPTDVDHAFDLSECKLPRDKDCWQCLYILQVELTLKEGHTPVAATTNLFNDCLSGAAGWERKYGHGSSELPSECERLAADLPDGWGTGSFGKCFTGLAGCRREAPVHEKTHEPLGIGCRWERRFLHSLAERVLVVATPPSAWAVVTNWYLVGLVITLGYALSMSGTTFVLLIVSFCRPYDAHHAPEIGILLSFCAYLMSFGVITAFLWREGRGRLCSQMRPLVDDPKYVNRGMQLSNSDMSSASTSESDSDVESKLC